MPPAPLVLATTAARGTRGREGFLGLAVDLRSRSRGSEPGGRLCVEFNDPTIFFLQNSSLVDHYCCIFSTHQDDIHNINFCIPQTISLFFFKIGAISQPLHQSDAYVYFFFRPFFIGFRRIRITSTSSRPLD
jgi:hypothetical protein